MFIIKEKPFLENKSNSDVITIQTVLFPIESYSFQQQDKLKANISSQQFLFLNKFTFKMLQNI